MKAKPAKHAGEVVLELNRHDEALLAIAGKDQVTSPLRLKRILVPIDFSDCSRKALQYAIPLAEQYEAAITLLHVVAVPPYYAVGDGGGFNYAAFEADYPAIEAEMRASGEKRLSALAAEVAGGKFSTQTMVRSGSASSEIIDAARNLPADLVVISTHGRTGLKHVLLGSVAERVIRHAPCPVLVVREREHEFVVS